MRPDGRRPDELRPVRFDVDFIPSARGSVLVSQGRTRVICTASIEDRLKFQLKLQNPMKLQ